MKQRTLDENRPAVSEIGLGCMGMSEFHDATDDAESIRTLHQALELGRHVPRHMDGSCGSR
jgi:aryl-alcohol dehydrogenase-like predicted oxidoreductase